MRLTLALVVIVLTCFLSIEATRRSKLQELFKRLELQLEQEERMDKRGSCTSLGSKGCEGNDDNCCRDGNPYTGTMRKCVNTGRFSAPEYTCVEA